MSEKIDIDDGGGAFPAIRTSRAYDEGGSLYPDIYAAGGMSLRDWFAGMALQKLLGEPCLTTDAKIAKSAYEQADAMIAARKGAS